MMMTTTVEALKIAALNDRFRKGDRKLGIYHKSQLVANLSFEGQRELVLRIRAFDDFNENNDPHQEHDFGSIEFDGEKYFWKIDYYDTEFEYRAEDPSDERNSRRLLTIMHSLEY
jgi:hypothetical protein